MEGVQKEGSNRRKQKGLGCVLDTHQLHTRNVNFMSYKRVEKGRESGDARNGQGKGGKWAKTDASFPQGMCLCCTTHTANQINRYYKTTNQTKKTSTLIDNQPNAFSKTVFLSQFAGRS